MGPGQILLLPRAGRGSRDVPGDLPKKVGFSLAEHGKGLSESNPKRGRGLSDRIDEGRIIGFRSGSLLDRLKRRAEPSEIFPETV